MGKRGCKERWREGGLRRQGGGRPCRGRIGSRQGATGFHSEGVNASGLTKGSRECDERVNMPPAARATSHVRTSHAPQRITDSKGACRLPTRPPAPGCSQCMSSHSAYLRVGNFLRKRRRRSSANISTRPPLISSLTHNPRKEPLASGTTLLEKNPMSDCRTKRKQLSERERLSLARSAQCSLDGCLGCRRRLSVRLS